MDQYLNADVDQASPAAQRMRERLATDWAATPVLHQRGTSPTDLTSDADRLWFAENPTRCIRLRYPTEGDHHLFGGRPPKGRALVLVFCPTDGLRFRLPIVAEPSNPPPEMLLSGDPLADPFLADILASTLNEVRHVWGDADVARKLEALGHCIAQGHRLADWIWP